MFPTPAKDLTLKVLVPASKREGIAWNNPLGKVWLQRPTSYGWERELGWESDMFFKNWWCQGRNTSVSKSMFLNSFTSHRVIWEADRCLSGLNHLNNLYMFVAFCSSGQIFTLLLMKKVWMLESKPVLQRERPWMSRHLCTQRWTLDLRWQVVLTERHHHPMPSLQWTGRWQQQHGKMPRGKAKSAEAGGALWPQDGLSWDTAAKNKSRQGIVGGKAMSVTPCKSTLRSWVSKKSCQLHYILFYCKGTSRMAGKDMQPDALELGQGSSSLWASGSPSIEWRIYAGVDS